MLLVIIIAISLSMDAFSLALAYGMYNFSKKEIINISIIVGLYHLIMPYLGLNFGNIIFYYISIKPNIVVSLIFIIIGINMFSDSFKNEVRKKITGYIEILSFGLAVSMDAFSTGIGIKMLTNNIYLAFIIFSIISFLFTYIGLFLGNKIHNSLGKYSSIIGSVFLILIGISYFFK